MDPASYQFFGALNFVVASKFSENLGSPELLTDYVVRNSNFWEISFILFSVIVVYQIIFYGLDNPGSDPGGDEIFRPSRPALGRTQPPVKWVRGLSRG